MPGMVRMTGVPAQLPPEEPKPVEVKPHRHYFRKDGTCRCGTTKGGK